MYTIFISHNSKDKPVVEPIAIRLAKASLVMTKFSMIRSLSNMVKKSLIK